MIIRFVAPVLIMVALAFACGPRSHSSERPHGTTTHADGPAVASSLDVSVGKQVTFAFHVTNSGSKRIELNFPNGQTHDIVVLDSLGREVWRWSEGRMFTQSLQNKLLSSNETLTYQEKWTPPAVQGRFQAVAVLKSVNYPLEQRVEFAIP